jgi:hypothetical protein
VRCTSIMLQQTLTHQAAGRASPPCGNWWNFACSKCTLSRFSPSRSVGALSCRVLCPARLHGKLALISSRSIDEQGNSLVRPQFTVQRDHP